MDCEGCADELVCGGAGQPCCAWDCGVAVDGGAGQGDCEASGCCGAGFCAGPTLIRVGAAAGGDVGGFCAANFGLGLGFGLALAFSAAVAGGAGAIT